MDEFGFFIMDNKGNFIAGFKNEFDRKVALYALRDEFPNINFKTADRYLPVKVSVESVGRFSQLKDIVRVICG